MSAEQLALLVGLLMPPIVAFVRGGKVSSTVATLLSVAVSLAVGTVSVLATDEVALSDLSLSDIETLIPAAIAAFASSTLIYNVWFKQAPANVLLQNRQRVTLASFVPQYGTVPDAADISLPPPGYDEPAPAVAEPEAPAPKKRGRPRKSGDSAS